MQLRYLVRIRVRKNTYDKFLNLKIRRDIDMFIDVS